MPAATRNNTRIGRLNALTMTPAALFSAGLIVMLAPPGHGALTLAALATWLVGGLLLATRIGERAAMRMMGLRPLRRVADMSSLTGPAMAAAGFADHEVDWYLARTAELNAFASGRRSIAVTTGLLSALERGQCSRRWLTAILVHDLLTAPTPGSSGVRGRFGR